MNLCISIVCFSSILVSVLCAKSSSHLIELVKRIFEQSDSTTVYFIKNDTKNDDDDFLTVFMAKHCEVPVSILTSSESIKTNRSIDDNSIIVLRSLERNSNFIKLFDLFVKRLRVRKFIVIATNLLENLRNWFDYLKDRKFSRIFGVVNDVCYVFLPYEPQPDDQIKEIVLDTVHLLPDALKNLNGFAFRTSLQRDIPRSFAYPGPQGKRSVGGSYGQVLVNFVRRHNATYKEITISNSTRLSIPELINSTISNKIDISMNVFTPTPGLDYSYPVKYVMWNVLVPLNGYMDPNKYFIKPFSALVWLAIGISFVYIIVMEVLKDIYTNLPPDVWNSFSQTMLAMLNYSSEKPLTSDYSIHIQVLFLSFILGKLYNIYVTSFLTVFIKIKQFETIQDLIDNNVRVMMPFYEWALISDEGMHPEGLEKIVTSVDYPTYIIEMNSMRNTSYAYGVGSDRGEFLIGMQTYFAKPLFHPTIDGIVELHLGFLLAPNSPFTEVLSNFVIEVMDTGLLHKWDNDAIVQGMKAGFEVDKTGQPDPELPIPLTFKHLSFAWNCLIVGWFFSTMVFVGERLRGVFRRVGKKRHFSINRFRRLF